jgi:HEPN domain-containing protein
MTILVKTQFEPTKIFEHASVFHKSYELLSKSINPVNGSPPSEQDVGLIAHPSLVLSAFASEIYLKCLLCVETGSIPNGHNLRDLFMRLNDETKFHIDDLWDTDIRYPDKQAAIERMRARYNGEPARTDLRYALKLGARGFTELRYFYEHERSYFLLSHFPYVLRTAILNRFPSWASILPKPSKDLVR